MKKSEALVAILVWTPMLVWTSSTPASAELCTVDAVPAATLLLPYFEVDISDGDGDGTADCDGVTTSFTINNAAPEPALAHITWWTDWSFPVIDFDVFLTGFDAVHVDMCEALGRGNLPVTADAATDPNDTISPHQQNPEWDGSFPNCDVIFPFPEPVLVGALLERAQNGHAGYPVASLGGDCAGEALNGDGSCSGGSCPPGTIARGYVTIDSVSECSTLFPADFGYFVDGGQGVANNANRLWGDFLLISPAPPGDPRAAIGPLVHVEADDDFNAGSTPTQYTFYGRFTRDQGGIDNREPLGTGWAVRYFDVPAIATDLVVWRDSTSSEFAPTQGYACGTGAGSGPEWNPLHEVQVTCFDDAESFVEVCSPDSDPPCFPLETQRLRLGEGNLQLPFQTGACHLNLNQPGPIISLAPNPFPPVPLDSIVSQSYVAPLYLSSGNVLAGGSGAVEQVSACELADLSVPGDQVFADAFESGDTSGWME